MRSPDQALSEKRAPVATDWTALVVPVGAVILSILPVFLVGTLAPGMRAEIGFSEVALGGLVTTFSLVTAMLSFPAGRFVEGFGQRRSLAGAASLSGIAMLTVGTVASTWWQLAAALGLAGLAVSASHPAANLALARSIPPERQGLAFGIKQASIPAAIFLAGLAVPLVAETVGWRWAFRGAGVGALAIAAAAPLVVQDHTPAGQRRRPLSGIGPLLLMTGVALFGVAGVQAIATFLVEAAVADGLSAARTGLLLSAASVLGVSMRIGSGWWADRVGAGRALLIVALYLVAGAAGLVFLSIGGSFVMFVIGTLVGLGAGWSWNGLVHFATVRRYRAAPATATGVIQVGVFVGAAVGPLGFGAIVTEIGYPPAWLVAGGSMVLAGVLAMVAARTISEAGT